MAELCLDKDLDADNLLWLILLQIQREVPRGSIVILNRTLILAFQTHVARQWKKPLVSGPFPGLQMHQRPCVSACSSSPAASGPSLSAPELVWGWISWLLLPPALSWFVTYSYPCPQPSLILVFQKIPMCQIWKIKLQTLPHHCFRSVSFRVLSPE